MFKNMFKKKQQSSYDIFIAELKKNNGDLQLLNKMIESKKIDINFINENGQSFLHIALKAKKQQNAMWLLSKNIKPNIKDKEGTTAFDIAINFQYHKVIKELLKLVNVDLNKKDNFGRTVLQDSVVLGDHEMAMILIEHGADINIKNNQNRNVFYDALSYDNKDFIDYLLNINELELNTLDLENNSIFNHKSVLDDNDLALKLIKKGVDPTILNSNGKSFLCECALNKGADGLEIINSAIEKGFDINAPLKNNETILTQLINKLLSLKKQEEEDERKTIRYTITVLVKKGLNINTLTKDNETVLFNVIRKNNIELVKLLVSLKINLNIQNNNKRSALALAVHHGSDLEIIIILLQNKADPSLKNLDEKTLFEEINDIILGIKYPEEISKKEFKKQHLNTQYINILKQILKYYKGDINLINSVGNPIFYKPLMHNNIPLFYLYTSRKDINLQILNKNGHNLFFEYIMRVFEDNNENIDFKSALKILISKKISHNIKDETGWTAVSKIIATTPCNINLFTTLIKVVKFDYTLVDKLGRTAIHSAVWKGRTDIVKIINFIDSSIKDIPDNYGILPLVYAAILEKQKLVLLFNSLKAKSSTEDYISVAAIKKFTPFLKNLDNLTKNINDPLILRQINDIIVQIRNDFNQDIDNN